jgi:hypothetical protein
MRKLRSIDDIRRLLNNVEDQLGRGFSNQGLERALVEVNEAIALLQNLEHNLTNSQPLSLPFSSPAPPIRVSSVPVAQPPLTVANSPTDNLTANLANATIPANYPVSNSLPPASPLAINHPSPANVVSAANYSAATSSSVANLNNTPNPTNASNSPAPAAAITNAATVNELRPASELTPELTLDVDL